MTQKINRQTPGSLYCGPTPKTTPAPREKTPGPHGITLQMREITRALPVVVHEHKISEATMNRFKGLGYVPNRKARRAYARARRVLTPRPTLTPYEK